MCVGNSLTQGKSIDTTNKRYIHLPCYVSVDLVFIVGFKVFSKRMFRMHEILSIESHFGYNLML